MPPAPPPTTKPASSDDITELTKQFPQLAQFKPAYAPTMHLPLFPLAEFNLEDPRSTQIALDAACV
jgi:hypothetical protein